MSPRSATIGPPETGELSLPLTDLAHLFNAPRVDPLSPGPLEGLGISGVDYLLSLLHLDKKRQRAHTLTLSIPAAKTSADSAEQLTNAIHRTRGGGSSTSSANCGTPTAMV